MDRNEDTDDLRRDNNKLDRDSADMPSSSPVSKIRCAASQYCAISASSLLTLSFGMSIGFSTILIPELYKKDAEIVVTREELTWISSVNYLCIPIGAIASGPICKLLGRRNTLILATLPYIVAWLLFHYSGAQVWPIFVGYVLLGTTGGMVEAPVQIYVTEISEPRLRGSISASVSATITAGIFLQILIGSYVYWRTLTLINLAFPALAFIAMTLVPESPYWFAMKGRNEAGQRALCWLRGWTTTSNIKAEYETVLQSLKQDSDESLPSSKSSSNEHSIKLILKRYFRRSVYLPFLIVTFAFLVGCFNGNVSIITYAVPLFEQLESPIDEYTSTIILAGLQVVASILLAFIVPCAGKRKPTFASLIVAGLASLVVAVFTFLRSHRVIVDANHGWIPSIAVVISVVATAMGIKSIPWVLSGEVFPTDVRDFAAGIVGSTCNIYSALASKTYLYMVDAFTLPGTFLFFACVNFLGLGVLYYAMPETEGKTLAEIEQCFVKGRKAKEREMDCANVEEAKVVHL